MNAYINRPLLYVSLRHDATRCRYLAQQGWRLIFANNRRDLEALNLGDEPVLGGLLDLDCGYSDAELEELEPWLAQQNIGWIGVVANGDLLSEPMRKLLGLYFVDYYNIPCDSAELARALGHAIGMANLRPATLHARDALRPDGMIGNCPAMQSLFRGIEKVSKWDTPVLISGESGTGKELAARAVHCASRRAGQPFIAVNCAAIPPTLLMSELFGYERGAFTGAVKRKLGRIEMAHGGTLFLDEIGDMPLESQTSLLRFLETGCIERLGSTESVAVDVRVISATHVDLEAAIAAERFRGDLYHRLCVLRVRQPALRERDTDILLLAEHILNNVRSQSPEHIKGFSPTALRALSSHTWPGNVRELINRIRHAAAMCEDGIIKPADLDLQPPAEPTRPPTLAEAREAAERCAVKEALQRNHERLIDVAEELGISRVTLFRMMREHKLQIRKGELGMVCVQG